MEKLFVEVISVENGLTWGVTRYEKTVLENIKAIYKEQSDYTRFRLMNPNYTGVYDIARFHQFVVYTQFTASARFSMSICDFNGTIDAGLDQYLAMIQRNWTNYDGDVLMKVIQDIIENPPTELAEMEVRSNLK